MTRTIMIGPKQQELNRLVVWMLRHITGADEPRPERRRIYLDVVAARRHERDAPQPEEPPASPDPNERLFQVVRSFVVRLCCDPRRCKDRDCRRTGRCLLVADLDRKKAESAAEARRSEGPHARTRPLLLPAPNTRDIASPHERTDHDRA